jgi:hypothetical protein
MGLGSRPSFEKNERALYGKVDPQTFFPYSGAGIFLGRIEIRKKK